MRLGFHYHIPASSAPNGGFRVPGFLGRFIDSLGVHCDQLTCFLHEDFGGMDNSDYTVKSENTTLAGLPVKGSVPYRMIYAQKMVGPVREAAGLLDVMLIRGPSPLLFRVARAVAPTPTCLLLVGDYLAGVDQLPQPRWRKELIRWWSAWNKRQQDRVARESLVIANNSLLCREYESKARAVAEVWTTTLNEEDIVESEFRGFGATVRLLYSGRMDSAKGLDDVVEAFGLLSERTGKFGLDLVGWRQEGDLVVDRVIKRGRDLGVEVVYQGFKEIGSELFEFYDRADIFVLASRGSEGFPRAIFEAMARGVPVIATRAGDIPFRLEDGEHALLVDQRSPRQLAMAIERLMSDEALCRSLVQKGRLLATHATLEKSTARMVELMKDYLGNARGTRR